MPLFTIYARDTLHHLIARVHVNTEKRLRVPVFWDIPLPPSDPNSIKNAKPSAPCRGASEVGGCFGMKLNVPFPGTGCRTVTAVDDERSLRPFHKQRRPRKLLLTLWAKNGGGMGSASGVGTTNEVPPRGREPRPTAACAPAPQSGPFLLQTGGLEKELCGVALCVPQGPRWSL